MERISSSGDEKERKTGLEQELNRAESTGELAFPEMAAAARQMAAEGIVLLKNEKHTLPLKKEDTVAVFGRTAVDYFTVGYGSGGDVIAPYKANLMMGLRERKVKLEENLAARYDAWCHEKENAPEKECGWGKWPMSYTEMPLTGAVVSEAAKDSSIALVVLGRAAGEDRENLLEKGSYYLTDGEVEMLDLVTEGFGRVCVILDCGNVIDMGWVKRYGDRIGAIVYAWQGGMESGYALADVLTGAVNPSGKLPDTFAESYAAYPGSDHFGGTEYNEYVEDIYVGYRYFETFHPEQVLYPFGFGLSYTDFSLQSRAEVHGNKVELQVQVSNTGETAGKQVVQVYLGLPCGRLGNPKIVLAAFGKTRILEPGEVQELELSLDLAEYASFDDSGVTGHPFCYVLEPGAYRIEVGANARDRERVLTVEKQDIEVVRQCREAMAVRLESVFERMVNRDGRLVWKDVPVACKKLKKQILAELPGELAMGQRSGDPAELSGHPSTGKDISFADVLEGKRTAEEFVAQLTPEELDELTHGEGKMDSAAGIEGNAGAFGGVTDQLRSRGLPPAITTDGPSGIRIRRTVCLLPCGTALASSFNQEGVERLYALVSREMEHHGSDMLLAPGMNIHRNPLCGRNFEYFSEDPLLTGKMAAAVVRGIQSTGRSACPKHFACNNQERNRNYNDSRVSQRALREIYLKGFEIAVREAHPYSIMTSYNKINGVWSYYNYELATQILRQEWGYDGLVITDWWMREGASREFPEVTNDACRIRAQVDVLMPGEFGKDNAPEAHTLVPSLRDPKGVTLGEAQRCALNVVNFLVRIKKKNGIPDENQASGSLVPGDGMPGWVLRR